MNWMLSFDLMLFAYVFQYAFRHRQGRPSVWFYGLITLAHVWVLTFGS